MNDGIDEVKGYARRIISALDKIMPDFEFDTYESQYKWVGKHYLAIKEFLENDDTYMDHSDLEEGIEKLGEFVAMLEQRDEIKRL